MMTQSVMTQAANLFGNATGSVTFKGKKTGNGFDLMIDNLKAQNSFMNTGAAAAKKADAQKFTANSINQSDEAVAAKQDPAQQKIASDPNKDTAAASQTGNGKTVDMDGKETDTDQKESVVMDDRLLEQIAAMLQAVNEAVMEKLNLSPEEFGQLMNEMKFTAADLLEPENLQKIILADSKETSISAVLTNENLADTMKELLGMVDEIKSAAGLPLSLNQMKEILIQAKASDAFRKLNSEDLLQDTDLKPELLNASDKEPDSKAMINQAGNSEAAELKSISGEKENKPELKAAFDEEQNKGSDKAVELNSNGSKGASGKEDKSDLKSSDQYQMFLDNLVKASKETQTETFNGVVRVSELREIADQIIERIRISVTPDQTSMELKLSPENLGKVNLTVQSKNGSLTAQFVVQNEVSKEAIESQLATLRETLNHQGIKVEAIEVTVSANTFEQNGGDASRNQQDLQKDNSGRQITLDEALNMTEELQEEDTTLQNNQDTLGSRIDYTA